MGTIGSQCDVDLAFADFDNLLTQRWQPSKSSEMCVHCDGSVFDYATTGHIGSVVCTACGAVQSELVIYDYMFGKSCNRRFSNYKRIHHFHERISQLLLHESSIPDKDMLQIAEKLLDGTYTHINKDVIRKVLRPLNMQTYIEKWLQIIYTITGVRPPVPGPQLLIKIDSMFQELQAPFDKIAKGRRKNFLNYNYVLCRLFQVLGCPKFCMFFPLIKSKAKVAQLDAMWAELMHHVNWPLIPLDQIQQFAVHLKQPEIELKRIRASVAASSSAGPQIEQSRRGGRRWDRPQTLQDLVKRQRLPRNLLE